MEIEDGYVDVISYPSHCYMIGQVGSIHNPDARRQNDHTAQAYTVEGRGGVQGCDGVRGLGDCLEACTSAASLIVAAISMFVSFNVVKSWAWTLRAGRGLLHNRPDLTRLSVLCFWLHRGE